MEILTRILLGVGAAALVAGCQPGYDSCTITCGVGATCPGGWSCGDDGYCHDEMPVQRCDSEPWTDAATPADAAVSSGDAMSSPADAAPAPADAASAPTDAAPAPADAAPAPADAAPADAGPDPDADLPDAGVPGPLEFNLIFRQTVQACPNCHIWFDWQGVDAQKPRLVVEYQYLGETFTATYRHGLNGMDNAHGFFVAPDVAGAEHSITIRQTPPRTGLFRADLSDIPAAASITSATLYLHLNTGSGLSYNDHSSVVEVHACDRPWSWDEATWTDYASGLRWSSVGGDFGALIREIRAQEDLVDRGFSKSNPDANFDFTSYVQELQASR